MKKILKKLLTEDTVFPDMAAKTKEGIIVELIERLAANKKLKNKEAALKAVRAREKKMSTGMENGIAIPHGKSDEIPELVAAIGRTLHGVDFNSMDKKPSRIFIMTLSPQNHSGPHLQFLAEVSKLLKDAETRKKLLNADSARDILNILL